MFDYTIFHWSTFFAATLLLVMSPGPNIAFILSQVLKGNKGGGFAALFGIWVGNGVHIFLAAAGLSAILATSEVLFDIVKWVGAAYLIWMGYNAIKSQGSSYVGKNNKGGVKETKVSLGVIFRQSAIVSTLNPKTTLFFLTFLPQFIVTGAGPVWAQIVLHGVLLTLVGGVWDTILIIGGSKIVDRLEENGNFSKWADRGVGAILIALGIRLAFIEI